MVGVQSGSEKYHSNRLKTVSDTAEGTTIRALLTPINKPNFSKKPIRNDSLLDLQQFGWPPTGRLRPR